MKRTSKKIYLLNVITILDALALISLIILGVVSVLLFVGYWLYKVLFILGMICLFIVSKTISIIRQPIFAKADNEQIIVSTIFGKKLKTYKWGSLASIEVKKLKSSFEFNVYKPYIVLSYSNKVFFNSENTTEIANTPNIVVIKLSKRNVKLLREYLPEEFKSCLG